MTHRQRLGAILTTRTMRRISPVRRLLQSVLIGLLWCAVVPPVAAQPDAGGIIEQQRETLEQYRLQRKLEKAKPAEGEVEQQPEDEPDVGEVSDEKVIKVNRFDLDESEILTQEELAAIVKPHEGKVLSIKDLFDIIRQINDLYDEKRYPTARAVLPPQEVEDGVVRIRLVEAKVGEVRIEGAERTREAYVRSRVGEESGFLLSVIDLEEDLVQFNRLNDTKLRAKLAPGAEFGTTDVILQVQEPQTAQLFLFFDNAGRKSVGRERMGVVFRVNALTGRDDPLLITADLAEGSNSVLASYSTPIGESDLRFEISIDYGSIEVIDGPFAMLDTDGDSREITFGFLKPVLVTAEQEWAFFLRMTFRDSRNSFDGVEQEDIDLTVLTVGFNGEVVDARGVWYTEHMLRFGLDALNGEEPFVIYRGSITRIRFIDARWTFVGRGAWQVGSERVLPSSEDFQIGGAFTVRGFSEGLLSGRSGYYLSFEVRYALKLREDGVLLKEQRDRIELYTFIDHGGAFPFKGGGESIDSNDFLTGAGFGVQFDIADRVTGRVSIAWPLDTNDNEVDDMRPWVHFSVQILIF